MDPVASNNGHTICPLHSGTALVHDLTDHVRDIVHIRDGFFSHVVELFSHVFKTEFHVFGVSCQNEIGRVLNEEEKQFIQSLIRDKVGWC